METKTCKNCSRPFEITDDDLTFLDRVSPIFNKIKYAIPQPTHCPDCRQQRRLAICNEWHLYSGVKCGLCKKQMLSAYPPSRNQPVYCRECWHSDKWDARDYARDFDFSRPFFEQVKELKLRTPALALSSQGTCVNSDYIHFAGSCKNCYLIMHADFCEDCYYGYGFKKNIFCVDGYYNLHSELCYDCVDVHKCYDLKGSQDCISCSSSSFLRDCIGCNNCFCCVGLRNQEFVFENKKITKEEYMRRLAQIDTGSYRQYQAWKMRRKELEAAHKFKEFQGSNLENCFGNYLYNCKNARYCFDCEDVEDAKFCSQIVLGGKNIYDIYQFGTNVQESLEGSVIGGNAWHLLFSVDCDMETSDLFYCWYMESSKNCFGCVNMQHASYCILNKQYTKEEYEDFVPRIIKHMGGESASARREREAERKSGSAGLSEAELKNREWGEFFPMKISPYGYNKSSAHLWYPLTKEQTLAQGLSWDEYEPPPPAVSRALLASDLPDNIRDVSDDILDAAIECEATSKLFKLTSQELQFYKRHKIPLPRRCPNQRHIDRFHQRNPRQFWLRRCAKCQKEIQTTYSLERPEVVYCESCYMQSIY